MRTANGYDVTVYGALAVIERLWEGSPTGGYYTPAQWLGFAFGETLPGSTSIRVTAT